MQFDPSFENIDPDLDPMRMQELTLGVEHQVSPHVAVSARFVHKQLDKAVEDIGSVDADGNATYVIGNPGYHRATEAIRRCALSQGRSRLRRRGARRAEAAGPQLGAHRELRLEPPVRQLLGALGIRRERAHRTEHRIDLRRALALFDGDGRPSTDAWPPTALTRPRRSSSTRRPFGVNVGVFQSVASGLPVSRFAVLSPGIAPVFYAGRGSEGRTPALSQTDLSVQYVLALGGRKRLTVGLNVLNLFNQAQGVSRFSRENDQGVERPSSMRPTTTRDAADVGAAFDEQQVARDPRFLQYEFFQEPIKARVSVRFSF